MERTRLYTVPCNTIAVTNQPKNSEKTMIAVGGQNKWIDNDGGIDNLNIKIDDRLIIGLRYLGTTPLHRAIIEGSCEVVYKTLQKQTTNINDQDKHGNTALSLAIKLRKRENAQLLLENGANVDIANNNNDAPIHVACKNHDLSALKLIINAGADIYKENTSGNSMVVAIAKNSTNCFKYLLKEDIYDLRNGGEQVVSGVIYAVRTGVIDAENGRGLLIMLLQTLDSIDWQDSKGKNTAMILLSECVSGDLADPNLQAIVVKNLNSQDIKNNNLWHFAAIGGDINSFPLLAQSGRDVNSANVHGVTPFLLACMYTCSKQRLISLIDCGADPKIRDNNGYTALHRYAENKIITEDIAILLLKYIDVNSIAGCGGTALHLAAFAENYPLMKILIKHNANIQLKDKLGKTALSILEDESEVISLQINELSKAKSLSRNDNKKLDKLINREINYHDFIRYLRVGSSHLNQSSDCNIL